jgi:hypothetical protein
MAWDPTAPGRVYQGNDGGFYRSTLNGVNGSWIEGANQPWTQLYTVDVGEQNPARLVGGTQDNGCLRSWNSVGAITPDWGSYGGCGDGEYTVIDYTDQNFVYACSQFGSCRRSVNAGNSTLGLGATIADRRNWETPIVLDPNDPSVMYYGGNILNRTANIKPASGAPVWTAISPSLSNPASGTDPSYPFDRRSGEREPALRRDRPGRVHRQRGEEQLRQGRRQVVPARTRPAPGAGQRHSLPPADAHALRGDVRAQRLEGRGRPRRLIPRARHAPGSGSRSLSGAGSCRLPLREVGRPGLR